MTVGPQLYIYRKLFDLERESDLSAALAGLTGYSGVEGFLGNRFDYRRLLEAHGLRYHGVHLVTAELSDPAPVVSYLRTMGGADVCVSGRLRWNKRTADDYKRTADFLNGVGHRLRGDGGACTITTTISSSCRPSTAAARKPRYGFFGTASTRTR